jgi:hypothetical protein
MLTANHHMLVVQTGSERYTDRGQPTCLRRAACPSDGALNKMQLTIHYSWSPRLTAWCHWRCRTWGGRSPSLISETRAGMADLRWCLHRPHVVAQKCGLSLTGPHACGCGEPDDAVRCQRWSGSQREAWKKPYSAWLSEMYPNGTALVMNGIQGRG